MHPPLNLRQHWHLQPCLQMLRQYLEVNVLHFMAVLPQRSGIVSHPKHVGEAHEPSFQRHCSELLINAHLGNGTYVRNDEIAAQIQRGMEVKRHNGSRSTAKYHISGPWHWRNGEEGRTRGGVSLQKQIQWNCGFPRTVPPSQKNSGENARIYDQHGTR